MRFTPHLGVAAGMVVVGLAIALPALLSGGGSHPILETVPRVVVPSAAVVPAATATGALVPTYDGLAETDQFTGRSSGRVKSGPRIPLPPAPPLDPPGPPLLPLPEAR